MNLGRVPHLVRPAIMLDTAQKSPYTLPFAH